MKLYLTLFLQELPNIEEKIQEAPDKGYEIGVVIGTYLPLVLLFALAYYTYYRAKNRKDLDD
jgi:hypothetical protein